MRRVFLVAACVGTCACVVSETRSGPAVLVSGPYDVDVTVTGGSCWPQGDVFELESVVAVDGTSVTITTPFMDSTTFVPTMTGAVREGSFDVAGAAPRVVGSGCILQTSDAAHGQCGDPVGGFSADVSLALTVQPPTSGCISSAQSWSLATLAPGTGACSAAVLAIGARMP